MIIKINLNDKERDMYLFKHGIKTIRIDASDIKYKTTKLNKKIQEMKEHLALYEPTLAKFRFFRDIISSPISFQPFEKNS